MIITATGQQLWWLYAAWAAPSSAGLWLVARWYAAHRQRTGVLLVAVAVTLICVASVGYASSTLFGGPPRSDFILRLAKWESPVVLVSFVVWPFVVCAAVAQISIRFSSAHRGTRWVSFACGILISLSCPFALLTAGCGLANICL
jgi:hypothetical protein